MIPRLYLLSEVAEMTGLKERPLADAARANKLPTYRVHGRFYMSEAQIMEYLARFESSSSSKAQPAVQAAQKLKEKQQRRQGRAARRGDTP